MALPKTFSSGERLFASDLNDNFEDLDDRVTNLDTEDVDEGSVSRYVKRFANSSSRSSAIPSPSEGMVSYLDDVDTMQFYDGSAWKNIGELAGVRQIVTSVTSTRRQTSSTSFTDAGISVSITPTNASSTIYVFWSAAVYNEVAGTTEIQITNSSNTALEGAEGNVIGSAATSIIASLVSIGKVAAGSTSARTYKGRYRRAGGNYALIYNDNRHKGRMIAVEVR